MDIPDGLRDFVKETIKRAKAVDFSSKDPFRAYGFSGDPFKSSVLMDEIDYLVNKKVIDVNMGKIITLIYDIINSRKTDYNLDGVIYHYNGSGATTLVKSTLELIKAEIKETSNVVYIDVEEEIELEDYGYKKSMTINNVINLVAEQDIGNEAIPLVILDHSDYLVDFFVEFREAFKYHFPETSLILVFSYPGWMRLRSHLIIANYSEQFYNNSLPAIELDALDSKGIEEILKVKLSKNGKIQQPYSDEVIEAIAETSLCNLNNAIALSRKLCYECFYSGLDRAHVELVYDLASLMDFTLVEDFEKLVKEEDSSRVFLLTLITIKSVGNELGITYEELLDNMNLQKTTISYHLSQLLKKRIITKRTVDRKAYYKLNEILLTVADIQLLAEFNRKDRKIKFAYQP